MRFVWDKSERGRLLKGKERGRFFNADGLLSGKDGEKTFRRSLFGSVFLGRVCRVDRKRQDLCVTEEENSVFCARSLAFFRRKNQGAPTKRRSGKWEINIRRTRRKAGEYRACFAEGRGRIARTSFPRWKEAAKICRPLFRGVG